MAGSGRQWQAVAGSGREVVACAGVERFLVTTLLVVRQIGRYYSVRVDVDATVQLNLTNHPLSPTLWLDSPSDVRGERGALVRAVVSLSMPNMARLTVS